LDIGDMRFVCEKCGGLVWLAERIGKKLGDSLVSASICCMKGNVTIPAIYSRGLIVEVHIFYQI
jgi:hypothetical protein